MVDQKLNESSAVECLDGQDPISERRFSLNNTFAAMRYPNYRIWFAGQLVSLFGTWMQMTAQGYLAYQLTRSAAFLGYVAFANGLPVWLFMLYAGSVADRVPRKTLMLYTQSVMMVLAFILAVLTFTGAVRPWHILVLSFLLGIANTFDSPARLALVNQLVDDRRHLPNAVALNGSMFNLATALGPAAAGAVYALLGPAWCFTINGLSFVAVIAALLLMRLRPVPLCPRSQGSTAGIVEGLRYVWRHEDIRSLILLIGVTSLFGLSFAALIPAWAVKVLHGTSTTGATINGFLQSARGIGALLAALTIATVSHLRVKGRLATFGSFAYPIVLLVFAIARSTGLALVLMGLVGFASILVVNLCNVLIQSQVEDSLRGRVSSVYSLVFFGMMPIGSLLVGWLAQWTNEPVAVIVSACGALTGAILIWMLVPRLRSMG
ncbi:MAG TPA: MFS transporter [Clostridia bacterium]|nr:MFS transporter [Clostridia bacterium]